MSTTTLVVGGGHVGHLLARQLTNRGAEVQFVDDDAETVSRAQRDGTRATEATLTDPRSLREATDGEVKVAVAASARDSVNLLTTQLLRTQFGAENVVVLVNDPRNHDVFETLGVETVCASSVLADALDRRLDTAVRRTPHGRSVGRSTETVTRSESEDEPLVNTERTTGSDGPVDSHRRPT